MKMMLIDGVETGNAVETLGDHAIQRKEAEEIVERRLGRGCQTTITSSSSSLSRPEPAVVPTHGHANDHLHVLLAHQASIAERLERAGGRGRFGGDEMARIAGGHEAGA